MASKKVKNYSQTFGFIIIVLGFLLVANYLASKLFVRFDLTEKKMYSVSKSTKKILKNMDDIVNVNVYFSQNLPAQFKNVQTDLHDILSEYQAYAGKNLRISYVDPTENEEVKRQVTAMGVPEVQMQTIEKDKQQVVKCFAGLVVLYGDKKEVMPVVQNMANFEYDLTQAIMRVSRKDIPKIGVLKTDSLPELPPQMQSRMPNNNTTKELYKPIFESFEKNYEVKLVDVDNGTPIDSSLRTLIIPGGTFSDRDLFEIDQYFMKGGNLIVLVDAITVQLQYGASATPQETKIINLMEHYGARVEKDLVLDGSCGQVSIPQNLGGFTMNVPTNYPYFVRVLDKGFERKNPAISGLSEMIFPWVSSITPLVPLDNSKPAKKGSSVDDSTVKAQVLVKSSPQSWTQSGMFNLDPTQQWAMPAQGFKQSNLVVYLHGNFTSYFAGKPIPPVNGTPDSLSAISMASADAGRAIVTANTRRHVIIAGDADFVSNNYRSARGNFDFLQNVVDWLSQDESLISIRSREIATRTINANMLKDGSYATAVIRYVNILLMPILVVLLGLFIYIRRRETGAAASGSAVTNEEKKA